jgi:phosphate starvation-inducible protein PhoH and related proteins
VGQNITVLQKNIGIDIAQNGNGVLLRGSSEKLIKSIGIISQLFALVENGYNLRVAEVDQASRMLLNEPEVNLVKLCKETIFVGQRKKRIYPRSLRQSQYFRAIRQNDLVFGVGPAGTGKTYLAMAMALSALLKEEVKRIILCRPAVEAGEKLGFLPGDMLEKVNPYLRPLYDALFDLVGAEKAERFIDRNIIEVAPLAFMRGRTLSDAFVILDEAQNTTQEQMKMFLTRLGLGSKAVITGDPSQVDLPRHQKSGLRQALSILNGVTGIHIVELTDADVVRHPLVSAIIRAYAREGNS